MRSTKKYILLAIGLVMLQSTVDAQQHLKSGGVYTDVLPVKDGSIFANLRAKALSKSDVAQNLNAMLGLSEKHSFLQVGEVTDKLSFTHITYQQYYQGVIVDAGKILVHYKDGIADNINGKVAQLGNMNVAPSVQKEKAIANAQKNLDVIRLIKQYPAQLVIATTAASAKNKEYALMYKCRIDGYNREGKTIMANVFVDAVTGKILKKVSLINDADVNATGYTLYSGTRAIVTDSTAQGYRLRDNGRKIETYNGGGIPMDTFGFVENVDYFNNSTTWNLFPMFTSATLQTASAGMLTGLGQDHGIVFTMLDGAPSVYNYNYVANTRPLDVVDTTNLPATIRFHNIIDTSRSYSGAYFSTNYFTGAITDSAFYNISNTSVGAHSWNNGNGNSGNYTISLEKNPAIDAHWGMEKTYDFYSTIMGRNSYDNNGSVIKNYLNAGLDNNAGAYPAPYDFMVYGMGDGLNPFVDLGILGHEFTHMVTENNGNGGLLYQGESGALNESFSDILGTSIEFFAKGSDANWILGEDLFPNGGFIRSMSDPKLKLNPDTYEGQYWSNISPDSFDYGGVHTNSGVQNKWYYLLCQGGSGTNDKGDAYTVNGIGIIKGEQIAYRNLIHYLTPESDYMDAYAGSLQAAADLYGGTASAEYMAVKQAWYAVGIGSVPTGVNEIAVSQNDLKLYPNPATGRITISSSLNQTLNAQIVNVIGVPVMNITVTKGLNPIDISGLAKGMYLIRYNTGVKGYGQKLSVL